MIVIAPQVASMAAVSGAALASLALSLLALGRARGLLRKGARNTLESAPTVDAAIGVLQQRIEELQQQVEELRRSGGGPALPALPRAALNLDKRSQALRMHRHGEAPADIAAALGIPLQEVKLLLKVHRIVLRAI